MKSQRLYLQLLDAFQQRLRPGSQVVVLSIVIGLSVGMAAVGLKSLLHLLESSVLNYFPRFLLFFLPVIGLLLAAGINRSFFGLSGTDMSLAGILFSISRQQSIVKRSLMYAQLILSSVTLAFGGSVGFEAPMVITGSAWGSNIGRFFRLDYRSRTLFIGCGTAAGISAIFNAPIAGVIFAMEVMLPEISTRRFIPLLISAAMGNLLSSLFLENEAIFRVPFVQPIGWLDVFFVFLLGALGGLYANWFSKVVLRTGYNLRKFRMWWHKALFGGLALGTLIYFFPPLYGEGYIGIRSLIADEARSLLYSARVPGLGNSSWHLFALLIGLVLLKPLAAAITTESGGAGGKFGPSLVSGGLLGYTFALAFNSLLPQLELNLPNYTLLGMAAVLSGVMHAPLTAIFLIAEITGTYSLIVPLMLVAAMAYFIKTYLQPLSLVAGKLEKAGDLIHSDKDKLVLHEMELSTCIEKDIQPIRSGSTLGALVTLIRQSKRNIFPVLDQEDRFLGVILLDNIRQVMFEQNRYEQVFVDDLMQAAPAEVEIGSSMEEVMLLFDQTQAWNLPVVRQGKYVGFISKSTIFSAYRDQLKGSE